MKTVIRVVLLLSVTALVSAAGPTDYKKRRTALDKDLAQAHFTLAEWCTSQKMHLEAREHYERALALDPTHAAAAAKVAEATRRVRHTRDLRCEFRLRNETRLKAVLLADDFTYRTPAGALLIPAYQIDLITLSTQPNADRIVSEQYVGLGRLRTEVFSAISKAGNVTVQRKDVASIRILRPCDACHGKGEHKCRRCNGTGKLRESSVCPDCNGKGWQKCETCGGKGKVTCPVCGGQGRFRGAWGRMRRIRCIRCNGTGKIDCDDCKGKGRIVCPTCKGKPKTTKAGPCPVCGGKGILKCDVCGGSGARPMPKGEVDPGDPAAPKDKPDDTPQEDTDQ